MVYCKEDIKRFASYHIGLARIHGIDFTTIVITTTKPGAKSYKSPSMCFTPKIINLRERDADEALAGIDEKLKAGGQINELLLIYLPLYGSKSGKTTAELLDAAIKLAPEAARGDEAKKNKLQSLMILLGSTFMKSEELHRILEVNRMNLENNRAVQVLTEMGRREGIQQGIEQGIEQTASRMLQIGEDASKVSEYTGLTAARISELQAELQVG